MKQVNTLVEEFMMDDQDRMAGQDTNEVKNTPPAESQSRIREAVDDVRRRISEDVDVVREYEERYQRRSRLEMPETPRIVTPQKAKRRVQNANVNERKWAALAHASTLLTALVALSSGGVGMLVTMFIPFAIYFAFRNKSEFIAFHALQAFAIQIIGTIGFLALVVGGLLVWGVLLLISLLLCLLIIGIPLLIIVVLALPVFLLATLALPIGMVIYSVIATAETWSGHDYRYPYIARWVEDQIHSGMI
jgi:uncharacterized Tic20 family protein